MEKSAFKIKITVLWLFFAGAMSAAMGLYLMWPGKIEEIIAGVMEGMPISGGLLTVFALFWLIPLIMAFLTLVLKDSANRWTNLVVGILFTHPDKRAPSLSGGAPHPHSATKPRF